MTDPNLAALVEHLATAFRRGVDEEKKLLDEVDVRTGKAIEASDVRTGIAIESSGNKLKLWIMGGLLMQFPIIFFLGGLYSTNNATLALLQKQEGIIDQRGDWLEGLARSQSGLETWAISKGYEPPRPHDPTP